MSDINLCGKRAAGDLLSRCTCSFNISSSLIPGTWKNVKNVKMFKAYNGSAMFGSALCYGLWVICRFLYSSNIRK